MPSPRPLSPLVLALAVALPLAAACIPVPATSTQTAQTIMDMQDQITQVNYEIQVTRDLIDSLRKDVDFEDSVVRSLANLAGTPLPARGSISGISLPPSEPPSVPSGQPAAPATP